MLGGKSICFRKRDPSACMMIYILLVQTLQLQLQSILIYLLNITLTAKSVLHISQFVRCMVAALYHIAVELKKM